MFSFFGIFLGRKTCSCSMFGDPDETTTAVAAKARGAGDQLEPIDFNKFLGE